MVKEVRGVTYRLYPKKNQETIMNHFLDCTRNVYNRLVEICRLYINHNLPFPSEFDLKKMATKIRQRNEWMQDAHSHCFAMAAKRVYNAFVGWMKRCKDGVGFPRFKSYKMFDSFTYSCNADYSFVGKNGEREKRDRIRLGMIGLLKYGNPFVIKGKCKTATVYRRRIGNHFEWYVSIAYEYEDYGKDTHYIDNILKREDAGLDLGLNNIAVLSNGLVIPNDRTYRKKEDDLSKIQKIISKYDVNDTQYNRQLAKLSHKYKKMRNYRKDLFHKATNSIVEKCQNIFMEDLSVVKMMNKSSKGMRKSYRDASWGLFTRMLCYKAEEAGNKVLFVNPTNTSQLCSSCGTIVPKDLSVRVHSCPHCGFTSSRDLNAAINILNRGLRLQSKTGQSQKCNEGLYSERRIVVFG